MKCKLRTDQPGEPKPRTVGKTTRWVSSVIPAGTIIDSPEAHLLVRLGLADPVDEECVFACGEHGTPEAIADAEKRHQEIETGVQPDDLPLLRAGKITGYNPDWDPQTQPPSEQFLKTDLWTDEDTAAYDEVDVDEDDERDSTAAK